LDAYHIYQGFFKLNTRFQNLLSHINAPIKTSISTFSKSEFQHYYTDLIRPIQHRIKVLHLSDPLIVEYIFPIKEDISIYSQLQTLYLENIESRYLEDLLHRLAILPNLSSLTIDVDSGVNEINIYNQLFQLPVLKYCELSFVRNNSLETLPISANTSSPIEYLIINNHYDLHTVDALLSYLPQLRRLSITGKDAQTLVFILFNNSRQLSFTLANVHSNNDLEQFMKKYTYQIKLVHSCTLYNTYDDNDNIEIWGKSTLSYLPSVKIVRLNDERDILCDHFFEMYTPLVPQYPWGPCSIQQWFFTHESMSEEKLHQILCSFASHR
jgi:hypothetical protein